MAYTRDGKETFEVSYPIDAIWQAMPKAIAKLEWKVERPTWLLITSKLKPKVPSYPTDQKWKLV